MSPKALSSIFIPIVILPLFAIRARAFDGEGWKPSPPKSLPGSAFLISSGPEAGGASLRPRKPPAARWRSYRNPQYGFEVQYPADFNVTEDHAGYMVFRAPNADERFGLTISRLWHRGKLTLAEFVHNDTMYEQDHSFSYAHESVASRDGMRIYRFEQILGSSTRQGTFFLKDPNEGTMADYLVEFDRCNGGGCGPDVKAGTRIVKDPHTGDYERILATFRFIGTAGTSRRK